MSCAGVGNGQGDRQLDIDGLVEAVQLTAAMSIAITH